VLLFFAGSGKTWDLLGYTGRMKFILVAAVLALANLVGYGIVRFIFHLGMPKTEKADNYFSIILCYTLTFVAVFAVVHFLTTPLLTGVFYEKGIDGYYFNAGFMLLVATAGTPLLMIVFFPLFLLVTFGIGLSAALGQERVREKKRKEH
jgi:hypothetical protein